MKVVGAELADARESVSSAKKSYRDSQRAYNDLDAREREAWGPTERDNPKKPDEWKRCSDMLARTWPRVLATCVAMEHAQRRVARLSSEYEVHLRVTLARERMGDDGTHAVV